MTVHAVDARRIEHIGRDVLQARVVDQQPESPPPRKAHEHQRVERQVRLAQPGVPQAIEAEQVARIVGRQHLPIHGRVEELSLLKRDGERLDTLVTVRLGA